MEVYIEDYIAVNLAVNFAITYLGSLVLNYKRRLSVCVIASVVGTLCAIAYNYLAKGTLTSILCLLPVAIVLAKSFHLKKIIQTAVILFIVANVTAAAIYSIMLIPYSSSGREALLKTAPLISVLVALFCSVYGKKCLVLIKRKRRIIAQTVNVKLKLTDKTLTLTGLLDTGNLLVDADGNPVTVICDNRISESDLKYTGKDILVKTANGNKVCKLFAIANIVIEGEDASGSYNNVKTVLSDSSNTNYGIILNSELIFSHKRAQENISITNRGDYE